MYIAGLMGAAALVACFIFVEETYPPAILVGKASNLRKKTKNWGIHAKQEEVELDLRELLEKNVSRYVQLYESLTI
jgi:DHA1 family multidrug resistance protein-like MFS transporter